MANDPVRGTAHLVIEDESKVEEEARSTSQA